MLNKALEKYKNIPLAAKAALWFIVCSFLQKAISLVTTPIFTRILTTSEYGQFSVYNSWHEIVTIVVTFKLSEAVFNKSLVTNENNKRYVLSSYQALSAILWCVWFLVYFLFHGIFDSFLELPHILVVIMFFQIFFENAIKLWSAYQRFEYKYRMLILVTLTVALLNPIIGLIAIRHCSNRVLGRLIGVIAAVIGVGIVLFVYNIKNLRVKELKQYWKYALFFNLPLIPHYLSQVLLNQADRIMISRLIDESSVALYSLAYTIGMLATMITLSINNAYVPWMYRNLKDKKIKEIDGVNQLLLLLVAGVVLCVFFWAPEAVFVLGGSKYAEATRVVYPVACSVYFIFLYTMFANVELFFEKRKYVAIGTITSAVLNIILNAAFIPFFGYVAAAYTTLFCYICYGLFHVIVFNKIVKGSYSGISLNIIPSVMIGAGLVVCSLLGQLIINHLIIRMILFIVCVAVAIKFKDQIMSIIGKMRNVKSESD